MPDAPFNLRCPWPDVTEKLKEINLDLTDEDLACEAGQEEQLLERLSKKMQKDKSEIKALIESIAYTSGIAS